LIDVLLKLVTRIAPTPSGFLHAGNALNAVLVWLWARQNNASILLRIDDLDRERFRDEYVEDIFRTLEWLGIDWDLGPQSVDDFKTVWSQHRRLHEYHGAIRALIDNGLVYRCGCSRSKWLALGYSGCECASYIAQNDDNSVIRLAEMPKELSFNDGWSGNLGWVCSLNSMVSVIRRRDGLPSYQLASVVDDMLYETSHIIRGKDLVESTAFQLHLSDLLGLSHFRQVQFMHHPLIHDGGTKLSKSAGATSLKFLRESGGSAEQFYQWVGNVVGSKRATNLRELLEMVDMKTIPFAQNQGL
jgi:glutamyl/glutaminyl-tRNA synthetase